MGMGTHMEAADDLTAEGNEITYTTNPITPGTSQTVADGDTPTVAELGQAVENLSTELGKLITDVASIHAAMNSGE